ncbi:hypothetical protein U91I_01826 [alpha proteobacterium U9-1i]|nr:hypothetical protein U91I_01826 [alpha proteobacterium U9-1i]
MSEQPHGAAKIHSSKGGGNGAKWLVGAVAAAALVGGGYYVWKSMSPGQNNAEIAYNDEYGNDQYGAQPMASGPIDPSETPNAESAATDDVAAPAAAPRSSTTTRRATTARAEPVPEETIGVTPASVTTGYSDSDDIVVTAPRRPIWTRTPSARRLERLYPVAALERGREGQAMLHCTVQAEGELACVRAEETPGGFGNAALRVARTLRHAEQLRDGSTAIGSPVNLRVVFRIEDEERGRG